ncbi:DUF4019 domain-containing protein [Paraburkholderia sp. MMS20-SJTR3]|uniref:DUF4019 domain-containing protein n=1 Tax=Paraburkholderia sejongensis TaxID=2886946 RepID=A0ABS8K623_9BURK|nr:DUF4019 domain-containing protein [Paraburkholderia sp. MMS20-SJTR3]MCC8397591.1 DUF4019 domain-containing protein [Paraburkholderia sp. MMS20-SJTR3]
MIQSTRKASALRAFAAAALAACCTLTAAAEPGASADELLGDANRVLQQLDAGQYNALWQDAAPFMREKMSAQQFAGSLRQARQTVGAVSERGWAAVTRIRYTQVTGVPDGLYANVDFATTLADGHTLFEMVSFQLESDGQWRLTGYAPRQSQNAGTGPAQIATP